MSLHHALDVRPKDRLLRLAPPRLRLDVARLRPQLGLLRSLPRQRSLLVEGVVLLDGGTEVLGEDAVPKVQAALGQVRVPQPAEVQRHLGELLQERLPRRHRRRAGHQVLRIGDGEAGEQATELGDEAAEDRGPHGELAVRRHPLLQAGLRQGQQLATGRHDGLHHQRQRCPSLRRLVSRQAVDLAHDVGAGAAELQVHRGQLAEGLRGALDERVLL
mmetsp:Transcript_69126/g.200151  ORF Transcript_69126/g.200151 Transcript_69126/m.200151 type:complete len:217 (-) Transcript_69126:770-1420(-)